MKTHADSFPLLSSLQEEKKIVAENTNDKSY